MLITNRECQAYYSAPPFTSSLIPLTITDTKLINNILIDAFNIAKKWHSTNTTESHQISVVVGPILYLLQRLHHFQKKNKLGNENITVFNIYIYLSQLHSIVQIYLYSASFANIGFTIAYLLKYLHLSFTFTTPNLIYLKTSIRKLTILSALILVNIPSSRYKQP